MIRGGRYVIAVAVAAAVLAWAPPAFAIPGWYVGFGYADQSLGGDFDGTRAYSDSSGAQTIYAGKLSDGNGLAGLIGYGLNRYVGLELFGADTSHTATHQGLPDSTSAEVLTVDVGFRLTLPAGKSSEVFARVAEGVVGVGYSNYLVTNSTGARSAFAFGGGGEAYGLGVLFYGKQFGLELGAMTMQAKFDTATTGQYGSSPVSPALNAPVSTAYILFVIHQ